MAITVKKPVVRGFITSHYGDARADHIHQGIDIATREGEPVYAIAAGTVYETYPNGTLDRYGNVIVLKHAENSYSLYAHLAEILVSKNQAIADGQLIAKVGRTAGTRADPSITVDGAHLHLEMLTRWPPAARYADRLDPERILKAQNLLRGNSISTPIKVSGLAFILAAAAALQSLR